jgi:hypothetical protein
MKFLKLLLSPLFFLTLEERVNVSGNPEYAAIEQELANSFDKKLKEAHLQGDERVKYE